MSLTSLAPPTGAPTLTEAVLVLPVPALEVTVTELTLSPAVVPVTLSETRHRDPAGSVPPERLTVEAPGSAVAVPPQPLPSPLGFDTTSPAGRLSAKAIEVSPVPRFGFAIANESEVEPFRAMWEVPNDLSIVAGLAAKAGAAASPRQRSESEVAQAERNDHPIGPPVERAAGRPAPLRVSVEISIKPAFPGSGADRIAGSPHG